MVKRRRLARSRSLVLAIGFALVAVLPAFGVLVLMERDLAAERERLTRSDALDQASLVATDIASVVDGARQITLAIARSRAAQSLDPACRDQLQALRIDVSNYAFLAVLGLSGHAVCANVAPEVASSEEVIRVAGASLAAGRFQIGTYALGTDRMPPYLAFAQPIRGPDGVPVGAAVAAINLEWFSRHLADLHRVINGHIVVADRLGIILAEAPDGLRGMGRPLPLSVQALLAADSPSTLVVTDDGGMQGLFGTLPPGPSGDRLFVAVGNRNTGIAAGFGRALLRGYVLAGLGGLVLLLLAVLVMRHAVQLPLARLREAMQAWAGGDASARARLGRGVGPEFTALADAFNAVVARHSVQQQDMHALNSSLEARVAERTQALLGSNNRLQVEIAERELTEASLRQAQKLQAVGQLAGGLAHDFNNLLTALLGTLDLLRRRIPSGEVRQQRLVEGALNAVERGSRLTSKLLAFSRKQRLLPVASDLNSIVTAMTGLFASTLGRSIEVRTRLAPGLWPAMVDPNQLEAAMLNLALNARDAMEAGGVLTISTANVVVDPHESDSSVPAGEYVSLTVADTGVGIPAEMIPRVMEPFFTTKEPGKGSGLGLSQVHGLVRQSGGDVTVVSRPGYGTAVTLLLPRAAAAAHAPTGDGTKASHPLLPADAAILLVDDDVEVRDVTSQLLAEAGYTVIVAENADDALSVLSAEGQRIQLLIADHAMPGMTGLQLLVAIRQSRPTLATLLATGYAGFGAYGDLDPLSPDQVIRKPFRISELLARIERVLRHVTVVDESLTDR